ncbi:hemin transport system permease protein HmuU [mine drainage metagenome]|uniref:Hemin transport system permease protein HmuU n=1 Tax=mine drainage metagenome TaxID=410659 RepID=A0A1J5PF24_9ZZZZ
MTWAWVPAHPLFGLDPATHEPQRVVALLAAGIFGLGALPLFLFTPDAPPTGTPVLKAFGDGFKSLVRMVMTVGHYKDAAVYLASRMFYVDGMNAVLIYAGVYATGVMKWGALEMLFFGIFLSVLAVLGGFVGRWMDEIWGPKGSVRVSIGMSLLGIVAFLGMAPDKILYVWTYDPAAHAPLWNGPFFTTLPEVVFILIGFSNAIFITAQYASSRTLLTRLTPPEQTGAFFGVYALSGVATGWLGPMMVNLGTKLTHTQQGGFATITILLAIGFIGLMAPNLVRLLIGPDQRPVAPLSALTGAILLTLADTLARTVAIPAEIPVGIFTALLGGPFFLLLLRPGLSRGG